MFNNKRKLIVPSDNAMTSRTRIYVFGRQQMFMI